MKIARTKIDVYADTLSMKFGDIVVHFNILDAMKHPFLSDLHTCDSSCNESESEFEFDVVSDFFS